MKTLPQTIFLLINLRCRPQKRRSSLTRRDHRSTASTYEIMGRATAEVGNVSALVSHCEDAVEMLRIEAENVGGDALINVSCSSRSFGAGAAGTIISFKDRQEALKVLRDTKAVLK